MNESARSVLAVSHITEYNDKIFFSLFLYRYLSFKNNKERYTEVIKFKWFFIYFGSYTFIQIILNKLYFPLGNRFGQINVLLSMGALLLILI